MLNRRDLIIAATAFGFMPSFPAFAGEAGPFTLGVASGDPASDGFVIWTRLAPDPLAMDGLGGLGTPQKVRWSVFSDEAATQAVQSGIVYTHPKSAHTVHVTLYDLEPNRPYWYRFEALGAQSPLGKGRTLPKANQTVDGLKLVMASCSHFELGYFSAYRHMAAEGADYCVFLGDYIYEYSYDRTEKNKAKIVRDHDRLDETTDLAAYRNRYALYRTDPDLQALHAGTTCMMTWDDHEVENDYGGFLSQDVDEDAGFRARRKAAYQAYFEHMPLRRFSRLKGENLRLFKGYRFGNLAEITMLDGRQYRSAPACPTPKSRRAHVESDTTCPELNDPKRSMLGLKQERWLYQQFARSSAQWNLLGQDLMAATYLQKGRGENPIIGHWTDGWDGYPANRDRMIEAMQATRLSNPVILSGDIHVFWANELKLKPHDPESVTVAVELVGTSITADPPPYEAFGDTLDLNPHVKYMESRHRGYVSISLTKERLLSHFVAISDRKDRLATASALKSFVVEAGQSRLLTV